MGGGQDGGTVPAEHLKLMREYADESDARFALGIEVALGATVVWTQQLMELWLNAYLSSVPFVPGRVAVRRPAPRIFCADGFNISVQTGQANYCTPRADHGPWTHVECGFPSELPVGWGDAGEDADTTETVFPYMPIERVAEVLLWHGGPRES